MKILLHSSKTMKAEQSRVHSLTTPEYMRQAVYINNALQSLAVSELENLMHITSTLAARVKQNAEEWSDSAEGTAAALTFRGDIYSGLSASLWNRQDADFAQKHLLILSGLYGLLRPFDKIKPYRLEMGYKLMLPNDLTLEKFWKAELSGALDPDDTYINLTAYEYFKVIERQLGESRVISPKFLTISQKTGQPTFVTVHAKIARGSFANWLIKNKIDDPAKITGFDQLNYRYDVGLSTPTEPVFVCDEFGGLGLSVRLK
jgi:cytoplasmic iron level regulating protein YaaA (DUF328/UPF0246 family)